MNEAVLAFVVGVLVGVVFTTVCVFVVAYITATPN